VNAQTRIELHDRGCSCRGGSWVLLEGSSGSPCAGARDGSAEKVVLSLAEWKQFGKPGSVEAYRAAKEREEAGERREFTRYEVELDVRIARIPSWREPNPQAEDTIAEVIATGGALVRSMMAIERGEIIEFSIGKEGDGFRTRSQVMYVSAGQGPGLDGCQRLGLKFLDAPLPESFIPQDARPLP
jgi:hypothetical protein